MHKIEDEHQRRLLRDRIRKLLVSALRSARALNQVSAEYGEEVVRELIETDCLLIEIMEKLQREVK